MQNSTSQTLPQFLRDLIACPPPAGEGIHRWLYKVARQLHAHRGEDDIAALLRESVSDCGRNVPADEIVDAVRNAKATAWTPGTPIMPRTTTAPQWPELNQEKRDSVLKEMHCGLTELKSKSAPFSEKHRQTNDVICVLYHEDSLLCAGNDLFSARTAPRNEWLDQDLSEYQFIVPSPMTALTGTTKDGKTSARCLDNTGARRYLVIESDSGTQDEQAAILLWLSKCAPLLLATFSGGKSLHGWFSCVGKAEAQLRDFFHLACEFGADPATWTRCQLVRMPDGTRPADASKEREASRQQLLYINQKLLP